MIYQIESKQTKLFHLAVYLFFISILFVLAHFVNEITIGESDIFSWIDTMITFLLVLSTSLIFLLGSEGSNRALKLAKSGNREIESLNRENALLKEVLHKRILNQFKVWGLSKSEEEIALLLIKGFSSQEIATIRNSSDRTVRKQSTEIYRKANQSGRAALAAFFIEDLL